MANITSYILVGETVIGICDAPPNDGGGTAGNQGDILTYVDPLGAAPSTLWQNSDGTAGGWVEK